MMTVYLDELILINFVINFILLICVEKLLRLKGRPGKLIFAALFGAFYSAAVFLKMIEGFASSVLAAALMVWLAFSYDNLKIFLRRFVYLYIISFIFSGLTELCYRLFYQGGSFRVINGVLYFDISVFNLLLYSGICYFALSVFCFLFNRQTKGGIYRVKIITDEKTVEIPAIIDSANTLSSVGGRKVMVVEKSALGFSDADEPESWEFKNDRMYSFVPYNSVGKTGVLMAFLPKEAYILHRNKKIELKDILIGISETKISSDGRFKALLPCDAVENLLGGDIIEEIFKKTFHKNIRES